MRPYSRYAACTRRRLFVPDERIANRNGSEFRCEGELTWECREYIPSVSNSWVKATGCMKMKNTSIMILEYGVDDRYLGKERHSISRLLLLSMLRPSSLLSAPTYEKTKPGTKSQVPGATISVSFYASSTVGELSLDKVWMSLDRIMDLSEIQSAGAFARILSPS